MSTVVDLESMLETVKSLPSGDYAEVGVWRGEIAEYIYKRMPLSSLLWLFDSFEGHSDPGPFDDAQAHPKGRYSDTSEEKVHDRCPFAVIVKGWIPESLEIAKFAKFRFVRIDVDHYSPTKGALEFFLSRMVPGGIIEFDDYNHNECPGATKAVNELLGQENIRMPAHYRA